LKTIRGYHPTFRPSWTRCEGQAYERGLNKNLMDVEIIELVGHQYLIQVDDVEHGPFTMRELVEISEVLEEYLDKGY
jgi:hypothetical protein